MKWLWVVINVAFYTTLPALVVLLANRGDGASAALWGFIFGWFLRGDLIRVMRWRRDKDRVAA